MINSKITRLFLKLNLLRVLAKFSNRFILLLATVSKYSIKKRQRISPGLIKNHFQGKKVIENSPGSTNKLMKKTLSFLLQVFL